MQIGPAVNFLLNVADKEISIAASRGFSELTQNVIRSSRDVASIFGLGGLPRTRILSPGVPNSYPKYSYTSGERCGCGIDFRTF